MANPKSSRLNEKVGLNFDAPRIALGDNMIHKQHIVPRGVRRRAINAAIAVLAVAGCAAPAWGEPKDIKVVQIVSMTGLAEAYGKASVIGFEMGLEYATKGTMQVAGRKILVTHQDDQSKPDVAKRLLQEAFGDEGADVAVGANSSAATLAMIPVAEEFKKILIVDSGQADSITGENWSRYIFRVKQNTTQEAAGVAAAVDYEDASIATLSFDSVAGRDAIKAFKSTLKKAKVVHEEYVPAATADFTAAGQRMIVKLRDLAGRKIIYIVAWIGSADPFKIGDLGLQRFGIEVAAAGNILPMMAQQKRFPGMAGGSMYYFDIPKNPVNDWLVHEHQKRFKSPPDIFQAFAFSAAMALVTALEKTNGDSSTEKLIAVMEGMDFDTPKGKMTFRKEDHQAIQSVYQTRIAVNPDLPWAVPVLTRELKADEVDMPVRNVR
jgi:branched-chain amino acid transport system substrate-binding protein